MTRTETAGDELLLTAEQIDLCDREPIHTPGAIQPQGLLLCLREPGLTMIQVSDNLGTRLGVATESLLGQDVARVVGAAGRERLTRRLTEDLSDRPLYAGLVTVDGGRHDAVLHRHDGQLILELEPATSEDAGSFSAMYPLVRSFVASLQDAPDVRALGLRAVRQMRKITGFGRVLAYRFNEDGHGEVLAEDLEPGYDSYDDLHFPASDIPRQARALYQANHIRLIADVDYRPSRLVPSAHPDTGRQTDLSYAGLRSVSPVHLQYMRNMGTAASMSISIIVRGALWGLISCHHAVPRHVPFEVRTACEHLGQILSLQIEAKEERAESLYGLDLRRTLVGLLASMADREKYVEGLADVPADLLRFGSASGAAIVSAERCIRIGEAPPEAAVLAFAQWLSTRERDGVFASHHLARDYPGAADLAAHAAGVLAIAISQIHQHYVIWFRPEVVKTIRWAGDPTKPVGGSDDGTHLNPRNSFAIWSQSVPDTSLPWRRAELEVAAELRGAILAVVMRRAEELAALSQELERSNKELEAFSYSVSHDLRAPLRHIVGYADLLKEGEGEQLTDRGKRFLDNIEDSAHFAGALVDDLLSFSQMGRSALRIHALDLNELLPTIIRDLRVETAGRDIEWQIAELPTVEVDAAFLRLAFRNLLSNAVKYTRPRPKAVISLTCEAQAHEWVFHVADNGVGFNPQYVGKLFGVFQRLHRMEDFEGTGIGLANVRRIIERHRGRVWADSEPGAGATFSFSLPKSQTH